MTETISQFFDAWGQTDTSTRDSALRCSLSDDFTYVDPRTPDPVSDFDALATYVALYSQYAPGASARVATLSTTNAFHRVTVVFEMSDGKQQLGQYFVMLDPAGKISQMTGFVGLGAPE